jgi:hypothetical protein
MSNIVFPTFPGLDWSVKRIPTFATMGQAASNGSMVRVPRFVDPMWQFECSFEFLRDDASHNELNQMLAFFLARQGSFDSFLLNLSSLTQNPLDSTSSAPGGSQTLVTDSNGNSGLVRAVGAFDGAPGWPETIYELQAAPQIYDGNSNLLVAGTDYHLNCSQPNQNGVGSWATYAPQAPYGGYYVHLLGTPELPLMANFSWYYRVIFSGGKGNASDPQLGNDQQEFATLWYQMYEAREITLVSARE